jgi:hypothetical protein
VALWQVILEENYACGNDPLPQAEQALDEP